MQKTLWATEDEDSGNSSTPHTGMVFANPNSSRTTECFTSQGLPSYASELTHNTALIGEQLFVLPENPHNSSSPI